MKAVLVILASILGIMMLWFGLNWLGVFQTSYFGVKHENARREVYEQSQSYYQGKLQQLVKLKQEYEIAKELSDKKAIKATVRINFAEFDENRISDKPELYSFLKLCKYN